MKKYKKPLVEIVTFHNLDVITMSETSEDTKDDIEPNEEDVIGTPTPAPETTPPSESESPSVSEPDEPPLITGDEPIPEPTEEPAEEEILEPAPAEEDDITAEPAEEPIPEPDAYDTVSEEAYEVFTD